MIDRVIHEPARLVLVAHLASVAEADFVYLSDRTGLTAGNISSHMSRLEEAGYVRIRKTIEGRRTRTVYRLTDAGRRALAEYRTAITGLLGT